MAATASNESAEASLLAMYDFIAQRLAVGTLGAGAATAAELLLARQSLGLADGASIASAATLALTASTGLVVPLTGTNVISAVNMNRGMQILLPAPGTPLTYHATNNPLQSGRSYVCEPGDILVYMKDVNDVLHNWIMRGCGNTVSEIGEMVFTTANVAQPGTIKANGPLLNRADYPNLFAWATASGNMEASDAAWVANNSANGTNGKWSPGNGTTTFRAPNVRGDFFRAWSDGSTVDSGRSVGSFKADAFQGHYHASERGAVDGGAGASPVVGQSQSYTGDTRWARNEVSNGTHGTPRTDSETRPRSTAYLALIKF